MTVRRPMWTPAGVLSRRLMHVEFRAGKGDKEGIFTAKVLNYGVLDEYDTEFSPGMFKESMDTRMPRIVWGHDWRNVLGRWTDYTDTKESLTLKGELDDFDYVPMARQAWAQMDSGTIDQFSVGFVPTEWLDKKVEGSDRMIRSFTKGRLDEVSLVLVGAVPDTELLSMRSTGIVRLHVREPQVTKDLASTLLVRLDTGEIDLADALMELKQASLSPEPPSNGQGGAPADTGGTTAPVAPVVAPAATEGEPVPPVVEPPAPLVVEPDEGGNGTPKPPEAPAPEEDELSDDDIAEALALADARV